MTRWGATASRIYDRCEARESARNHDRRADHHPSPPGRHTRRRAAPPGDEIDIWAGGQWVCRRYEVGRPGQALIYVSFDPAGRLETVLSLDRATMRFRWPPAQDDESPADTVRRQASEIAELRDQLREVRRVAWAALRGSEEGRAETLRAIAELVERVVGKV